MKNSTVHLGYEVGTGEAVSIPIKHLCITGQTQESGKTTTLEALVARSGMKALAFSTKRGEGAFPKAHQLQPYFREQTDWKYVAAILEASRGEKLKWERAWIIRASKGARTLADVQTNVRNAMEKARGQSESAYLCLDAYLDDVVPLIGQMEWAKTIDLQKGINVMNLESLNVEMQHLVLRSSIDWMLQHGKPGSLVVIPEAWKFIPQGRNTPVKLAAEAFIRQAAGIPNFLWLDSQDIAGIEKIILKSVPVWLLGVQRESNEIKRTLDQIPAGIKRPSPADIATLQIGEFFVCWGTQVIRVYVQPVWMTEEDARAIARGESTAYMAPKPRNEWTPQFAPRPELKEASSDKTEKVEIDMDQQERTVYEDTILKLRTQIVVLKMRLNMPLDDEEKELAREAGAVERVEPSQSKTETPPTPTPTPANEAQVDVSRNVGEVDRLPALVQALLSDSSFQSGIRSIVPASGVIRVEAKEAILSEFERAQVARLLAQAAELTDWQKQVVRFVESFGKQTDKSKICQAILGRTSDRVSDYKLKSSDIDELTRVGWLRRDDKGRVYPNLGVFLKSQLQNFDPSNESIEAIMGEALLRMKPE